MYDDCHAAYDYDANCITFSTDPEHMVEILKMAYGMSWKSQRISWMRKGEELKLNISRTRVWICMG